MIITSHAFYWIVFIFHNIFKIRDQKDENKKTTFSCTKTHKMLYDELEENHQMIFTNLIKECINKLKNLSTSAYNLFKFVEDFNKILEIFKSQKILNEVKIYDEIKENEKYKNISDFMAVQFQSENFVCYSEYKNSSNSSDFNEKTQLKNCSLGNSKLSQSSKKINDYSFNYNSRYNSNNYENLDMGNNSNPEIERTVLSSHEKLDSCKNNFNRLNSTLPKKIENKTVNNYQLTNNTLNIIHNTNSIYPQFNIDNFRKINIPNQGLINTTYESSNDINNYNRFYNTEFYNSCKTNNLNNILHNTQLGNQNNIPSKELLHFLYLQNIQNNPLFKFNTYQDTNRDRILNLSILNNLYNPSLSQSNNITCSDLFKFYLLNSVVNQNNIQYPMLNSNHYELINMLLRVTDQQNQINNFSSSNFFQQQDNTNKNCLNSYFSTQNKFAELSSSQRPQESNLYNSFTVFNDNPNSPISNLSSILMSTPSYIKKQPECISSINEKEFFSTNGKGKKKFDQIQHKSKKEFIIYKDAEMINKKRQRSIESSQNGKNIFCTSELKNKGNSSNNKISKKIKTKKIKDPNYWDSISSEVESEKTSLIDDINDGNFLESETVKKNTLKIGIDLYKLTYEEELEIISQHKEHKFMRSNFPNMYNIENFYLYVKLKNDKRNTHLKHIYSVDIDYLEKYNVIENKKTEEINFHHIISPKKLWNCKILPYSEGKIITIF